jgi:glycosyltransferase involved in cell wall biosynthesis
MSAMADAGAKKVAVAQAPLVSAIIIFLDAERFIEEAIESVLAQTYGAWELLLVDDGSSDSSTAIARRYAAAQLDRIRFLEHPGHANRGMSAARNLGIANARGAYVAFLDADDVWLPERLERHVDVLERQPDLGAVYGPSKYWFGWTGKAEDVQRDFVSDPMVETERRYEPPAPLLRYLMTRGGAAPCPTSLTVRRSDAVAVGGFEERFRGLGEDQAFLAKLWLARPVFVLGEPLDRYRQHPGSSTERAVAAGDYHLKRPNAIQRAYLDWLADHLDARGERDQRLRRALRKLQIPYRNPALWPIVYLPHRARDAANLVGRRLRGWLGSLGTAARPWR